MSLIHDDQSVVKGLVNPVLKLGLLEFGLVLVDHLAEGHIGSKFIELANDAIGCTSQLVSALRIHPVLGFLFNAKQHVQIAATRALLRL